MHVDLSYFVIIRCKCVHKTYISLVRYMIVLSCAKRIFLHQKKKYRILLISSLDYFPILFRCTPISLVLSKDIHQQSELRDRFKSKFYRFSRIRAPMRGDYVSSCICDRIPNTQYAIPLSILSWQLYRSRARFLLITLMFARPYRRGQQFC